MKLIKKKSFLAVLFAAIMALLLGVISQTVATCSENGVAIYECSIPNLLDQTYAIE